MGSFKLKLAGYFLILSLLPLALGYWGFSTVSKRSETRRVEARLQAGLRATLAAYQAELSGAGRTASELASNPSFQEALLTRDRAALHNLLRESPEIRVEADGGFHVGQIPPLAAQRDATVYAPGSFAGRIVVYVPLDSAFIQRLARRSGLDPDDRVVLLRQGIVVAGPGAGASVLVRRGGASVVHVDGERYRMIAAAPLRDPVGASFAVLSPQRLIDAATGSAERRLLVVLLVSVLLFAAVAYLLGRSIVRTLGSLVAAARALAGGRFEERVAVRGRDEFAELGRAFNDMASQLENRVAELEAERVRLREATSRLGEALAATHDVDLLLRVIVETAVESAGAAAGRVAVDGGETIEVGAWLEQGERIELPLQAGRHVFGTLVLVGPGFSSEERETALSFAAEAVIALENARLHGIVERQAAQDGLTGLANRRHCEESLAGELARAERFDGALAFALADLDDFKAINDRFGHPTGDAVLREFADTVRATVREVDVAGRWGGEEFALVLPGTDLAGAAQLAERVRAALEQRLILGPDGSRIRVTASFGVASLPGPTTAGELVAAADEALYAAKRGGKNRVATAGAELSRP